MTSTQPTAQTAASDLALIRGESAARLPRPRPRRGQTALAVGLILGGAGIAAGWAASSDDSRAVLVVVTTVQAGHRLTAGDLGVRHVGGDTAGLLAADKPDVAVGRAAVTDLLPGTLLTTAMVTDTPVPADTLVGIALRAGSYPRELAPGMTVRVMLTPTSTGGEPAAGEGVLADLARVVSIDTDERTGTTTATLAVAPADAGAVARASAASAVSVVVVGEDQ
jgi:hypothetical protein